MTLQEVFELNIFGLAPFHDLPFAEKEKLSRKFSEEILAEVAEEVLLELPEEKAQEFAELFGSPHSPIERAVFLNNHVPNFEEILVYETLAFKEDLAKFSAEKMRHTR